MGVNDSIGTSDDKEKWRLLDSVDNVVIEVIKGANQTEVAQALRQTADDVDRMSGTEWGNADKQGTR